MKSHNHPLFQCEDDVTWKSVRHLCFIFYIKRWKTKANGYICLTQAGTKSFDDAHTLSKTLTYSPVSFSHWNKIYLLRGCLFLQKCLTMRTIKRFVKIVNYIYIQRLLPSPKKKMINKENENICHLFSHHYNFCQGKNKNKKQTSFFFPQTSLRRMRNSALSILQKSRS